MLLQTILVNVYYLLNYPYLSNCYKSWASYCQFRVKHLNVLQRCTI